MIKIQNVYYMLAYAFRCLNEAEAGQYDKEPFAHVDELFAVILAKGIGKQLKRGLRREYRQFIETAGMPRGKIRLTDTVRLRAAQKQKISCEPCELTENTQMNQILKAACMRLAGSKDVSGERKNQLKKVMGYFAKVDTIDCRRISWDRLSYHRSNASYKMLMQICRMIIESMLISEKDGRMTLARYLDDQKMHQLYEAFLFAYFQKHYPEIRVTRPHISWNVEGGKRTFLPSMRTDMVLEEKEKILIIDAKYYASATQEDRQFGSRTIHSHNLYQIYAYVKNKDTRHTGNVSGMLLYAQTDGINPDVDYQMDGNKISVKSLNLNADFSEIQRQLDQIICCWRGEGCGSGEQGGLPK